MIGCQTPVEAVRQELADVIRLFFPMEQVIDDGQADRRLLHRMDMGIDGWHHRAVWMQDGRQVEESCFIAYPSKTDQVLNTRLIRRGAKLAAFRAIHRACPAQLPWGALTGIRPTKLMRQLIEETGSEEGAVFALLHTFGVSRERVELLSEILRQQRGIYRWGDNASIDVYIGIPFCRTRCLYCSFISVDMSKTRCDVQAYADALCREIQWGGELVRDLGRRVRAVYVGGGTPSAIGVGPLRQVLDAARAAFPNPEEFTVEAGRPDTLGGDMLPMLRDRGVSRISINPQTLCDATLRAIGRDHTGAQALDAVHTAKGLGFAHINMDLIMGLPGEGLAQAENTLAGIAKLPIDNLTVHTLTVKRSSGLHEHLARYPLPDTATVEAMVERGRRQAGDMGMVPYYLYRQKNQRGNLENVGYTLPGAACIYNIDIMEETHDTLAMGAGAISKHMIFSQNRHERLPHPKSVPHYMEQLQVYREKLYGFFGRQLNQ
jgi:coproporphyrinogen dehydrogenase HemZ